MTGIERIAAERRRQIAVERYDADHDKGADCALSMAAACYAAPDDYRDSVPPTMWPWDDGYWKPSPKDRLRELEKAGALIAAAIDALLATPDPAE